MPPLHTQEEESLFLHAYGLNHNYRVVAVYPPTPYTTAQDWTITNRGKGRFAIHQTLDGVDRYLTGQDNNDPTGQAHNGIHVFALPQDPNFERQTWRIEPRARVEGYLSLGQSGDSLSPDLQDSIYIQPEDGYLGGHTSSSSSGRKTL